MPHTRPHDFSARAFIANIRTSQPNENTTSERFTENGSDDKTYLERSSESSSTQFSDLSTAFFQPRKAFSLRSLSHDGLNTRCAPCFPVLPAAPLMVRTTSSIYSENVHPPWDNKAAVKLLERGGSRSRGAFCLLDFCSIGYSDPVWQCGGGGGGGSLSHTKCPERISCIWGTHNVEKMWADVTYTAPDSRTQPRGNSCAQRRCFLHRRTNNVAPRNVGLKLQGTSVNEKSISMEILVC